MSNLPPDQSYREFITGLGDTQQRIILSVSDGGISLADEWGKDLSSVRNGTHIFAECIVSSGTFSVSNIDPDHTFTLSTTSVKHQTPPEGEKHDVRILAVNGANNENGTARNAATIDGKPGPAFAAYVQDCTKPNLQQLYLTAKGGDGGDTKEKGGTAGNGGKGGFIQFVAQSAFLSQYTVPLLEVITALRAILKEFSGDKQLDHTHFVFGQIQKILQVVDATRDSALADTDAAFKDVKAAMPTWKSKGGKVQDVGNTVYDAYTKARECWNTEIANFQSHLDVRGGAAGSAQVIGDGGERGSSGDDGPIGSLSVGTFFSPFEDDERKALRQQTRVFIHPEQCEMLYERAMTYWTLNARDKAMELLTRLVLRLAFLPFASNDALYKAYKAQETALQCPNSIDRLEAIRKSAVTQLSVLTTNLVDYAGRSPHWVPRLSYTTYKDTLRQALDAHEKFEKSYIAYAAAKKTKDEAKKKMREVKQNADKQITDLDKETKVQRETAITLKKKIKAAENPIKEAQRKFKDAFDKVKSDIIHTYELSPETMISAAKTVVSSYTDKQGMAKLAYQVGKEVLLKVPNDEGEVVDKDLLIGKIQTGAATALSDFKADIEANSLDGMYDKDVKVPKMLLEQAKLKTIFADYTKSAFAKVGKDLQNAFKVLTDMLIAWNDDKMAYNTCLHTLANLLEQKKKANDAKSLADKTTVTDPDLNQMTDLAAAIYNNSRARVLACLREAQLALWFKTLVSPTPLYRIGDAASVAIDDLPLSITSTVLENMHQKLSDEFNKIRNDTSNAPTSFPADWDNTQGLKCELSSDLVEKLFKDHRIEVFIPPVLRGQTTSDLSGQLNKDFVGMADVRIHRVRFFWKGLKEIKSSDPNAEAARLQTDIFHGGKESIVLRKGDVLLFEHKRLDTMHSYFYRDGKPVDQHTGTFNGGSKRPTDVVGENTELGQPGPFTTWTLDVSNTDWTKWKKDDAKDSKLEGYIEFSGSNYPFEP